MDVKGIVVSVEFDVLIAKKDGGNYPGSRLSYRDENGKLVEQAFHNNALKFNPTLKEQLKKVSVGDSIIINKEKKGEFWNVISVTKAEGSTSKVTPNAPVASPKSTYETADERAKKQVYIVRQSSIANAVAYFAEVNGGRGSAKATVADVIKVAREFEAYVFGEEFDDGSIDAIKDDANEVF
jgi:hypothetical protein